MKAPYFRKVKIAARARHYIKQYGPGTENKNGIFSFHLGNFLHTSISSAFHHFIAVCATILFGSLTHSLGLCWSFAFGMVPSSRRLRPFSAFTENGLIIITSLVCSLPFPLVLVCISACVSVLCAPLPDSFSFAVHINDHLCSTEGEWQSREGRKTVQANA